MFEVCVEFISKDSRNYHEPVFSTKEQAIAFGKQTAEMLADIHLDQEAGDYFEWTVEGHEAFTEISVDKDNYYVIVMPAPEEA